jgi:crossover junction endodeoxyribonuclease RuvC
MYTTFCNTLDMNQSHQRVFLGIDPGYGICGYAFIKEDGQDFKVLNYGVITTEKNSEFIPRLLTIAQDLQHLIDRYAPDIAGVEKLFFFKNAKTAMDVGQARGVILLKLVENSIPIVEITPLQVKQGITGHGRADKQQIQRMVQSILKLHELPTPDDAADALAVALVTAQIRKIS